MARRKKNDAGQLVDQIVQLEISEQVALLCKLKELVKTSLLQKEKELSDLVEKFNQ